MEKLSNECSWSLLILLGTLKEAGLAKRSAEADAEAVAEAEAEAEGKKFTS